ncbi:hypothetical protein NLU13_5020 [Sarocladium strictum]|uniref:Inositol phoshorylceramide synthase regulatory subunit kei1 n=1 Tax=Sarocladium strictum TaxID=5046 RepID=A0AA39GK04_SARSR|nr:hypothetical protein NLU13_5020 [Sarocladium strictum]
MPRLSIPRLPMRSTRMYLRVPRMQSMMGVISLKTATELISLALVFNKVTGVYGLLAILTGFQLSFLQLSTYVYSIGVLVALVTLIPHIRRQSPFECLALAWLYILDTFINSAYTAAFGLDWYFRTAAASVGEDETPKSGLQGLKQETAIHGKVVPQETAASMVVIIGLTLVRIYFALVVMSFAQQTLQKHMQIMILEGPGVDAQEGPFAADLPDGEGRKGRLGRLMVSYGRGYWLEQREHTEGWSGEAYPKPVGGSGTLAGVV